MSIDTVQVFQLTTDHFFDGSKFASDLRASHDDDNDDDDRLRCHPGQWAWWYCLPGCLPDSDPYGPFDTEAEAVEDARNDNDVPVRVEMSGEPTDITYDGDEDGWYATVTLWLDAADRLREQTVRGDTIERIDRYDTSAGAQCYAVATIGGPGKPTDEAIGEAHDQLFMELKAAGYAVTVLP